MARAQAGAGFERRRPGHAPDDDQHERRPERLRRVNEAGARTTTRRARGGGNLAERERDERKREQLDRQPVARLGEEDRVGGDQRELERNQREQPPAPARARGGDAGEREPRHRERRTRPRSAAIASRRAANQAAGRPTSTPGRKIDQ